MKIKRSASLPGESFNDETPKLKRSEERPELYDVEDVTENELIFEQLRPNSSFGDDLQFFDEEKAFEGTSSLDDDGSSKSSSVSPRHTLQKQSCGTKFPNLSQRVVEKSGHRNVIFSKIPERSWRYCKDVVTTLVEQKWRYTFTMFAFSYILSWFVFAVLWYLIGYAHGDLFYDEETGERLSDGEEACVRGAKDFAGFFTYSVETQVSIGYGEKYPSEECPEGIFVLVAQIIVGIGIEGAMVGIIYAKMSRPPKRTKKVKFSKNAVICQRDGYLCLLFRLCDPTEQQTISTKIRAYYFEEKITKEGERLGRTPKELTLENKGIAFIMWPVTVCHVIDRHSPLYNFSAEDLQTRNFEIVISLVGSSPSTGQMTQTRTSYLPNEILWGQRFPNIIHYNHVKLSYAIDYGKFHFTTAVDTPQCSARKLNSMKLDASGESLGAMML